jgi:hypothetical protein
MSTVYKIFGQNDIDTTRTLLHESIPVTGTLVSGTYSDSNIKNYTHGRFQSVYDYPYLSSSANHIFDISVGLASDSSLSGSSGGHLAIPEKIQMYNQMAQVLMGNDVTGSIIKFDEDGDIVAGGTKLRECVFLSFARLLVKDEIKKGSVQLVIGTGSYATPFAGTKTVGDYGADNEYRINSPAGDYGILYSSSAPAGPCGLVFYQAGVMVLTASLFGGGSTFNATQNIDQALVSASVQSTCDAVRTRVSDIDFNNTVELNSTIYFCRVDQNEFNYSSNPTYLSSSQIRVKSETNDQPISYITSIGLYSSDGALLAVAKLSEPLRKDSTNSMILRTRLDF